ncbi:Pkinase-fungal domain-containing protein [Mycena venus]|uniref:Pkinase-fungal domain-containing protein n=1 Tax=Mycena venus TaxID=2733690 RepID=A0A8H6TZA7_9AGAR|nr:Pkinase-fungal domain-containing protein [Mycena venus]
MSCRRHRTLRSFLRILTHFITQTKRWKRCLRPALLATSSQTSAMNNAPKTPITAAGTLPATFLHSSLEVVLTRLGASELVHKLAELKKVADTQLNATLKASVVKNFDAESATTSNPADRTIDGRYWLCRLADAARGPAADDSLLALDYFPTPAEKLPRQEQHGYKKDRKYDASLRPSAAKSTTIFNVLVNVEFTKVKPPPVQYNPLIGASSPVAKYQQAITNADDVLTFQPTRLFVPTLSFHGKGKSTQLFVSILSQERFEFAVVENCFASAGFPTVSALLHLFRTASLYHLGYNPLFTYNLSSPPPNFSVGDAVPASVILPGAPGVVHLNGKRLSQLRSTPFKRSTVVLEVSGR